MNSLKTRTYAQMSSLLRMFARLLGHHHLDKLFVVDLSITINIGFTDHFIDFFVSEFLAKVGHNVAQLCRGDETVSILVKDLEGFQDFLFRVGVLHLACHHCKELGEVDGAASIGIDLSLSTISKS